MNKDSFKGFAIATAKEAGKILEKNFGKTIRVRFKGPVDLVTEVDVKSEKFITGKIKEIYPDHSILAEEGDIKNSNAEYKWIIDPLDGTTNYAHAYPFISVSIALEFNGEVILGVVHDPLRNETFFAEKGKGAYLNGKKIRVSNTQELIKSLIATGFPYDLQNNPDNNIEYYSNFVLLSQGIRRDGSAALDMCYTAMGRFDGFWEHGLKPWDLAAGSLIISEAQGIITDYNGGKFSIYSDRILASNGKIHDEMMKVLTKEV